MGVFFPMSKLLFQFLSVVCRKALINGKASKKTW